MKKAMFFFEVVRFLFFVLAGCEPIEFLPIEKISTVTFDAPSGILEENDDEGISIGLHLSVAAAENGEVSIKQINLGEFNPIRTSPEISSTGIIRLPVSKGSTNIRFRVFPVKDEMIRGNQEIRFQIDAVSGTLSKGSIDFFELLFLDNEE